jgi:hypothetical protein
MLKITSFVFATILSGDTVSAAFIQAGTVKKESASRELGKVSKPSENNEPHLRT